jgi:hypothetical protein
MKSMQLLRSVLLAVLATGAACAQAESALASGDSASASSRLRFRVTVPPIVRVLDNLHPAQVRLDDLPLRQELEVQSTLRQGFCLSLRLATTGLAQWTVRSQGIDVVVRRTGEGYRVCAPRHGRYRVALDHQFVGDSAAPPLASVPWPVITEISPL